MTEFTIYRDVPVVITWRGAHVRKAGGKVLYGNYKGFGDIPVCTYNETTKQMVPVVNPRGYAYAYRNDAALRRNRKKDLN